jgi:5'-3' exonuclease
MLASQFSGFRPIFLWDSQSEFRKKVFPDYKANRVVIGEAQQQAREDFHKQRQDLQRALTMLGITQMRAEGFEADDLAFQLVKSAQSSVVLVTGDRDWLQMLRRPDINWFYHREKGRRLVNLAGLKQETGVTTVRQFVQLKAIAGDASDNIPGIGGIGEKGAIDLLNTHGGFDEFLEWAKAQSKLKTTFQRVLDNQAFEYRGKTCPAPLDTYYRNLELVDLYRCPPIPRETVETVPGRVDQEAFKSLAQELAFRSMLSDLDGWMQPFTRSR